MKRNLFALVFLALSCGGAAVANVALATGDDARAMLERAVTALKADKDTALREFNDPGNPKFHDRDLYVFCFDTGDGKITAYSTPGLIGIDVRTLSLKDDPIGQRAYDTTRSAPEGAVTTMDFNFPKPGTTEPVPKQSLEAHVGDQGCAVAYYK